MSEHHYRPADIKRHFPFSSFSSFSVPCSSFFFYFTRTIILSTCIIESATIIVNVRRTYTR